MTHNQILNQEIVEKYVRGRLSSAEAEAFEEHYFACENCFEHVQAMQRFVDGIKLAAESGALPAVKPTTWMRPAFYLAAAAAVVMSVATGWMALSEIPKLRDQVAVQKRELETSVGRVSQLEARLSATAVRAVLSANLALVMLEASRASGENQIVVPAGVTQFAAWMELAPNLQHASYRLELVNDSGRTVEAVQGLVKNSYGALAASVPTTNLPAATYRARLFGVTDGRSTLINEYKLTVRR